MQKWLFRVRCLKTIVNGSELAEGNNDSRNHEHFVGGFCRLLVISAQFSEIFKPCEGSLHDPSFIGRDKLTGIIIIKGTGPRQEIWEIPLDVFKEAVMNAICHRDLYEEGATIMVEVYDDRVEISNPGGLLPVVAAEFGHKSMSRNPLVFGLFTRMHVVEKVGSGVPRMRELIDFLRSFCLIYKLFVILQPMGLSLWRPHRLIYFQNNAQQG